jgi:DNA-3-methyladenine glycosylase II
MSVQSNGFTVLTEESVAEGIRWLSDIDSDFAEVIQKFGSPPLWVRPPGFPTLEHIILEQQVSLASAQAANNRLLAEVTTLTPERFLAIDDITLKEIGFSRQKSEYCRRLADSIIAGQFIIDDLSGLPDEEVRVEMKKMNGIGDWTVDIYLLLSLQRADIWPPGDLALIQAVCEVKKLASTPSKKELEEISQRWSPWRSAAARILWHYYLSNRKKKLE